MAAKLDVMLSYYILFMKEIYPLVEMRDRYSTLFHNLHVCLKLTLCHQHKQPLRQTECMAYFTSKIQFYFFPIVALWNFCQWNVIQQIKKIFAFATENFQIANRKIIKKSPPGFKISGGFHLKSLFATGWSLGSSLILGLSY